MLSVSIGITGRQAQRILAKLKDEGRINHTTWGKQKRILGSDKEVIFEYLFFVCCNKCRSNFKNGNEICFDVKG